MRRVVALALLAVVASPVLAGKPDKKKEKGRADVDVTVVFAPEQRHAVQDYFVGKHGRGHCPPGLAKKNNGCLPPGQAKKRYTVGRPCPTDVVIRDVPTELSVRIGVAPPGYRYGVIDGDVVKLAVGTMLVVDAIDGLVH
ncbi:MAG TPA: hypothetical protein VFM88_17120 [Vicinamibacteria bacterium]|nr:hypothetical protein [Vicinamibacteria bacterium]